MDENLEIYDLAQKNVSDKEIVKYCEKNGIDKIFTPEDVRKYVYHTAQQIQEIFA